MRPLLGCVPRWHRSRYGTRTSTPAYPPHQTPCGHLQQGATNRQHGNTCCVVIMPSHLLPYVNRICLCPSLALACPVTSQTTWQHVSTLHSTRDDVTAAVVWWAVAVMGSSCDGLQAVAKALFSSTHGPAESATVCHHIRRKSAPYAANATGQPALIVG
jgi:hypothetical protein